MAKKSKVVKNIQRQNLVKRFASKRAELKAIIKSPKSSVSDTRLAYQKLEKMPRDANPIRVRNRCNSLRYHHLRFEDRLAHRHRGVRGDRDGGDAAVHEERWEFAWVVTGGLSADAYLKSPRGECVDSGANHRLDRGRSGVNLMLVALEIVP